MERFRALNLGEIFTAERLTAAFEAVLILAVGLLVARLLAGLAGRLMGRRGSAQNAMVMRRVVFYVLAALTVIEVMHHLGFQPSVLLGAAGILTVAVGFASQTSASNIISGLFLIAERPFVVGDVITVEGNTGEVLSIDALSVKLRTFDNLLVRVPNETLIKASVKNLTHFPIRRIDLKLGVAYREDLERVRELLAKLAAEHPLCLDEPEPLYIFQGFGDSALEMQFSVWAARQNFLQVKTELQHGIKSAFDAAGIEIPFPHRTLYAGSETSPLPVRVVADEGEERG